MHLPPIIIAIICFALIFSLFVVDCNKIKKESWVNYQNFNFGNVDNTNSDKVVFYNRPQYRKPYNYPVCHLTRHPVPHCRTI